MKRPKCLIGDIVIIEVDGGICQGVILAAAISEYYCDGPEWVYQVKFGNGGEQMESFYETGIIENITTRLSNETNC